MPGACLNPYGCEWGIGYLWKWVTWPGRLDLLVLALMLAYAVVVSIRVSYRCHLARPIHGIDPGSSNRRRLLADLRSEARNLKSIAFIAPYLGLAGTCVGLLNLFRGIGMERHAVMLLMAAEAAAALLTTAAGILVAIPAVFLYNHLCTRIELLAGESSDNETQRISCFQPRRFPLRKRSPDIPVFAIIAAISFAIIVAVCTLFFPPRESTGFGVGLTSAGCDYDLLDRVVVLRLTNAGKLLLNSEQQERENLSARLSAIYTPRMHRTLYLLADDQVPFQTVADTISIVRNTTAVAASSSSLNITVHLMLPRAPCSDYAGVRSSQSRLSEKTNPKHVESQTEEEASWDPIVCWDCPTLGEIAAFFLAGLVLCAPIFLLIQRVMTRKRESAQQRRFLE
jgi:hypothetical protein